MTDDTNTEQAAPERIRVAQDEDGFWTCREAISGSQEYIRADQAAPATARMTPVELLALWDRKIGGDPVTDADRATAENILLAASFGSQAFVQHVGCDGGATLAMLRAFLTALIDPMSPDLDYLRMDPAAAAAARAKGGAA